MSISINMTDYQLHFLGLKIRRVVSVAGYDDAVMSGFTSPRLTIVAAPKYEMAVNGCRWLLSQCFGMSLGMSLDMHRDFAIDVTWRASVVDCARRILQLIKRPVSTVFCHSMSYLGYPLVSNADAFASE